MDQTAITISRAAFVTLPELVQTSILAMFTSSAITQPNKDLGEMPINENEKGLALLDETDAKLFLNNCSEKTRGILELIVENDGRFLLSQICYHTENTPDQLRGAWSGLTKRLRNVTKDKDATLLGWFRKGEDWRGVMTKKTTDSMRIALQERL